MVRGSLKFSTWVRLGRFLSSLLAGAVMLFSFLETAQASRDGGGGWNRSLGEYSEAATKISRVIQLSSKRDQRPTPGQNWDRYENLSPEDKARLRNRYREWESLPPEKREDLRRRMEKWKELPPEDRELLRKRHEQWQELSPQERQRLREKLDRWNELPAEEQERVRQRFRRP